MGRIIKLTLFLCFSLISHSDALPLINSAISQLQTLPNFHLNVFASHINAARELTLGSKGTVFVGSGNDSVYAIEPNQSQTSTHSTEVIADHLKKPGGVAFADGNLFVATENKILRYTNIEQHLKNPPKPTIIAILPTLTSNSATLFHYLAVGPDDKLYVSVPAPCDHCHSQPPYASILQMNTDGTHRIIYAKGIRASLGFDWLPTDNSLWFTSIGETDLGEKIPPATINRANKPHLDFGFPNFYGNKKLSPHHTFFYSAKNIIPPTLELPAHVEPMGLKFYSGRMFPTQFHNQILVAEHGLFKPGTETIGHQIILVTLKNNKAVFYQPFVWGFHTATENWGDPVDLLNMADGSILISDDNANTIYRLSFLAPSSRKKTNADHAVDIETD